MLLAVPFGLAIGLALGMVGGGGAVLAVPVLVYVLGQDVHSATTASLAIVACAAVAGALVQARTGQVCWAQAGAFAVPALAGIAVGTAGNRATGGSVLLLLFVPVMLVAAWAMWRKAGERVSAGAAIAARCPAVRAPRSATAGLGVGLLTGFFGVGGGFLVVPILATALALPLRAAIGTSLAIVSTVSVAALTGHLLAGGHLPIGVTVALSAACAAGALAGAHAGPRISQRVLGRGFALLVGAVAGYLLVAATFLSG